MWNIPFTELADINLANVKSIVIGFGDGNEPYETTGAGEVYFEDVVLGNGNAENPFYDGSVYLEEDPFVNGYMGYPLFINQGCPLIEAGAGYIDEYPYLLGKHSCVYKITDTNNLRGIPDTNMVNIGFHYFDWNSAYGPLQSDLYRDWVVNFNDFMILANGWLTTYDYNDLVAMADEWLGTVNVSPPIAVSVVGDGNNGFVEVGAEGYSDDTYRIFLYVDGQYAGEIFGFWNGDVLGIDVSKLDGGEHQFKAVGVNGNREITCSNITSTEFACPLNYLLLPSTYEPNKPLYFSAFNPSAGDVNVNVYADCNSLVWSQTYSGDSISDSIPAEITDQNEIDYVCFSMSSGASVTKMTDLVKPPSEDIKALIVAYKPSLLARADDWDSVRRVQAAFKVRGINYVKLSGENATYDNIKSYAENVKYMYINAHGNYQLEPDGVLRTLVYLYDGPAVSMKKSELLLYGEPVPLWCVSLGFWEDEYLTKSFYSMGFTNLEFVYFDTCYSGRLTINIIDQLVEGQPGRYDEIYLEEGPISDMSLALGLHKDIFANRGYQGWYDIYDARLLPVPLWWFSTYYELWTRDMWWRLGAGDTVGEALTVTIGRQPDSSDPYYPVNNFGFKGNGEIDNIQLVGN